MSIEIISDRKEEIMHDVLYVEQLFFGGIKSTDTENPSPKPKRVKSEIEYDSELESDASESDNKPEEKEVGEQIMLPEVGSFVEATYVNVGSVFLKKAKRKSTCLNVLVHGKPSYIVGSYFGECEVVPTLVYGDKIKIEKTSQFKRAANREHAKSAKFKITKL